MRIINRIILTIIILTTIGIFFRGWIYRNVITYKSIGQRPTYLATDDNLIKYIDANQGYKNDLEIKHIIKLGLSKTSQKLNFTFSKNENDPNKLFYTNTAHCVGYASFFTTSCNTYLESINMAEIWSAKTQIGQLYFLGTNLHNYFNSDFFKDHDFVVIENKTTGEIFAVDPTINDYLFIDFITYTK